MKNRRLIIILIIAVMLVTMACGIQINLPERVIKTGQVQTEPISIAIPDGPTANLSLKFGAGELTITPGAQGVLVDGQATFNVPDLAPEIEETAEKITLQTGTFELDGFPNFEDDVKNEWDLKLASYPMELEIEAGAFKGDYQFGGLALTNLFIRDGASEVKLDFRVPNLVSMETFRYETGASKVELTGLANANFQFLTFRGGAGDYVLDFSGNLTQDAVVRIQSGVSRIKIIVPEGVPAKVLFSGGLANIDLDGEWMSEGTRYSNPGSGPMLTFEVDLAAGSLELDN